MISLRPSCELDSTARTVIKHLNKQYQTGHTSLFTILHMAQIMTSSCFKAFDWKNKDDNQKHYGNECPPHYNLSTITVPVAIFWSENDCLATAMDMVKLKQELTNIISIQELDYLHLDYLWGTDSVSGLYKDISRLLLDLADKKITL